MNKFKVGDLVHLNPESKWNDGSDRNPLKALGEVIDTERRLGWGNLTISVIWVKERFNLYGDKDLLPAPESLILKYLNKSLKEELKKRGIKS